ncbi:hypothetical protein J6590_004402, partial [Homalodisca vitripennis]
LYLLACDGVEARRRRQGVKISPPSHPHDFPYTTYILVRCNSYPLPLSWLHESLITRLSRRSANATGQLDLLPGYKSSRRVR